MTQYNIMLMGETSPNQIKQLRFVIRAVPHGYQCAGFKT